MKQRRISCLKECKRIIERALIRPLNYRSSYIQNEKPILNQCLKCTEREYTKDELVAEASAILFNKRCRVVKPHLEPQALKGNLEINSNSENLLIRFVAMQIST